jgi:hypothetical protein
MPARIFGRPAVRGLRALQELFHSEVNRSKEPKFSVAPAPSLHRAQLETLFDMFDPMGKGSVSADQYKAALEAIGVDNPCVPVVRVGQRKVMVIPNAWACQGWGSRYFVCRRQQRVVNEERAK